MVIPDFLPTFGNCDSEFVTVAEEGFVDTPLKTEIESLIQQKVQAGEFDVYDSLIEYVERELITQVLEFTQGNQAEASNILGITRTTLRTKIKKLGIQIKRSIATRAESDSQNGAEGDSNTC